MNSVLSEFTFKTLGEKARWELDKDAAGCFGPILEAAPYKTAATYLPSHKPSKTKKTC